MSEQRTIKGVRAIVTDEDVVAELRTATAGKLRAWAREHKVSPSYVSDVLRGARAPGEKIRAALGFEQIVVRRETRDRPEA